MKQVAMDSSGKIKGASDSALASCCPMMDGLRVARAPDILRAAGHLDLCVGKKMERDYPTA